MANRVAGHLHRVPGAILRFLQDRLRAQRQHHRAHIFRLVPHDHENLGDARALASAHHMLDQRAATRAVKNFRKVGTHPRSFPGGQNDDVGVARSRHVPMIVARARTFGNGNTGFR